MPLAGHEGALLVAHGTVSDLDDLPEFLARIRHGRPSPPELLSELRRRYEAIGGSPLSDITRAQAKALAQRLDAPVFTAMRLWQPSVAEVLRATAGLGLRRLAIVALAPFSVDVYWKAALDSLESVRTDLVSPPELVRVDAWGTEPAFVRAHAQKIRTALGDRPDESALILSAHSLPTRAIQSGDRYEVEFRACAQAIGRELGHPFEVAFQSQGADGGDWLGPDLGTVMEEVARRGVRRIVLSPVGFVAEHVETLYDLDVEAAGFAKELDIALCRVPTLDTDPTFIEALDAIVTRALEPG